MPGKKDGIEIEIKSADSSSQSSFESFENILNFRDVGKTINDFLGKKYVAEGKIFRSARPDDATISDRKQLHEEFGIKTIVDLRTSTEHANRKKKRLIESKSTIEEPSQLQGMNHVFININGRRFERSLLWQLSFWNFIKLIVLMLFGYRMEAIRIIGSQVMQPRGLIGLGFDTIDHCGSEIAETLSAFANPKNHPILVHCTQGKDRTGLIVAIILLLLQVPIAAISHDYILSEEELLPEHESRMVEIKSIGLSEDFAGCPPRWIEAMANYLTNNYGGVREYCRRIGFKDVDEEKLIELFRGPGVCPLTPGELSWKWNA
ncbi:Uncharacterized protein BP5553_01288 [Venustampulla echinocandica]|uniref:Tyrosine specific protein phosphatases domain-containing protein n=1 Tax=Venustampulla echinocandica TaxID=2656787 RepID=A0A370U0L1_9HELO|nr:Uncharacterized protein BP5553_01288 [Venustampulla echinocandica]RDL41309.1 Uncharacterized protein BP5553_01288 [Venustampulla echinocandica]